MKRCPWARNELSILYHDEEWGVPVHDDRRLFEFLVLEGAQAGLSWDTILKKRAHYREVMDGFDATARIRSRSAGSTRCATSSSAAFRSWASSRARWSPNAPSTRANSL